jgi:hypothetical protein
MASERIATGIVVQWLADLHRTHPTLSPIAVRMLDVIAAAYVGGQPPVALTLRQWSDRVQCMDRSAFRSLLDLEQRGLIKRIDNGGPTDPVAFELNPERLEN